MKRSDLLTIAFCPGCGKPIYSEGQHIGHRTKRYHNAACKQRYYRSHSYKAVQVFDRANQKRKVQLAELDTSIAEREIAPLKHEVAWLQEKNVELEGEVARLTTLLGTKHK